MTNIKSNHKHKQKHTHQKHQKQKDGEGSDPKSWSNIHSKISSSNKAGRRKIDFVKAKVTSFSVATDLTSASSAQALANNASKQQGKEGNAKTFKSNRDADTHDIKKELFPAAIVQKYVTWLTMKRIGPGMMNHGNTCFMNSVLQCLLHVAPLSQILMKESNLALRGLNEKDGRNNTTISLMYQRLVEQVFSSSAGHKSISPRAMINSIRRVGKQFRPHRQEDAHEYLRQLLDTMHEEALKAYRIKISHGDIAHTTLISKVFGGSMRNELKCATCNYSSQTFNHFQDISLELNQGVTSVDSSINMFTKKEKLGKGNEWFCEKCKKKVPATKQLTISTSPVSLVLHLKRFSFGGMSDKIKKHITFPVHLQLPVSTGKASHVKYELTGVVVHHGYSTHNGHYVAYVKSPSGQWYEMDDSDVSMTTIKNVLRQQAYLLFYTQVISPAATSNPTPPPTPQAPAAITQSSAVVGTKRKTDELDVDLGEVLPKGNKAKKAVLEVTKNIILAPSRTGISSLIKPHTEEEEKEGEDEESQVDDSRTVCASYPIELITRLPARTCRGMFYFTGAVGKLHQYRHHRLHSSSKRRGMDAKYDKDNEGEEEENDEDDDAEYVFQDMPDSVSGSEHEMNDESSCASDSAAGAGRGGESGDSSDSSSDSDNESRSDSDSGSDSVNNDNKIATVSGATRKQLIALSMRGRDIGGEGAWLTGNPSDLVVSASVQQHIESTQKKLRRLEQKDQAKRRPSDWDQMLDAGRQKKLKLGGGKETVFDGINEFQRLQDSVTADVDGTKGGKVDAFMQKMHHEGKLWHTSEGGEDTDADISAGTACDDDMVLRWDKKERVQPDNYLEMERNALLNFTKDDREKNKDRDRGGKGGGKGGGRGGKGGGRGGKGGGFKGGGGRGGGKGGKGGRGKGMKGGGRGGGW